jgi:hypothetical protein
LERYFFHLEDGRSITDADGTELKNLEEAKHEAVQLIAQTLCNEPSKFWNAETYHVSVTDQRGLVLFTLEMVATLSPAVPQRQRGYGLAE